MHLGTIFSNEYVENSAGPWRENWGPGVVFHGTPDFSEKPIFFSHTGPPLKFRAWDESSSNPLKFPRKSFENLIHIRFTIFFFLSFDVEKLVKIGQNLS